MEHPSDSTVAVRHVRSSTSMDGMTMQPQMRAEFMISIEQVSDIHATMKQEEFERWLGRQFIRALDL